MPLYDFRCNQGHLTEARRGIQCAVIPCPACGAEAQRQSVYWVALVTETGVRGGRKAETPRDEKRYKLSRFVEASEEMAYQLGKQEEAVGHELPTPPLYEMGKKKAERIRAGLEAPLKID